MATSIKSSQIYDNTFKVLLDTQDRSEPVPETHMALLMDEYAIERRDITPLTTLRDEWNKVKNLERISWVEDQNWEYEIFLKNHYDLTAEIFHIKMMMMLPKEAAVIYLLRWS